MRLVDGCYLHDLSECKLPQRQLGSFRFTVIWILLQLGGISYLVNLPQRIKIVITLIIPFCFPFQFLIS